MKRFLKRMLASVMMVFMLLSFVPIDAKTAGYLKSFDFGSLFSIKAQASGTLSGVVENITWSINTTTGVLTIDGTGPMPELGFLTSNPLYEYRKEIKSIVLSYGITSISSYAFSELRYFTAINIPGTVTSIGDSAFQYATALQDVYLPANCTFIGFCAFNYCWSLANIYYDGTQSQFNNIHIEYVGIGGNDAFVAANKYYNYMYPYYNGPQTNKVSTSFNDIVITPFGEKQWFKVGESFNSDNYHKLVSVLLETDFKIESNSSDKQVFVVSASHAESSKATITAPNYRDYIIPKTVMASWIKQNFFVANKSVPSYVHNAYMQLSRKDNKPYISTVFGRKSPSDEFIELKTSELKVNKNTEYDIVISLGGIETAEGYTYYLSQDKKHKIDSPSGVFNGVVLANEFERGKTIYAYAKSEAGFTTELQEVKIDLDTGTGMDWLDDLENSSKFNLFGKDFLKITIPSSVPLIGDAEISLQEFQLPAGFECDGDSLKISIGANIFGKKNYDYEKGEYEKYAKEVFKDWKDLVRTTTEASIDTFGDYLDTRTKYQNAKEKFSDKWGGIAEKNKSRNWDIEALGYVDFAIINGQLVIKEAFISIEGSFFFKYNVQAMFLGAPFYGYLKAGGSVGAQADGGMEISDSEVPFNWDLTIKLEPDATIGGGLGIDGFISAGAYANAKLPINANFSDKHILIQLRGELGLEGEFWHVKGKLKLWDGNVDVFETYWGNNAKLVTQSNPITGKDETYVATYDVVERNYLENTSQWQGNDINFDTMALSQGGMTIETLQSSVFTGAKPKVVSFGDKMLMTWIEDDSSRNSYNRMRLMYSIYDGTIWGEPRAVYDNGHNDNEPVIVTDGEDVYFAWQKLCKTLTDETYMDVNNIIENCEIYIAKYDNSEDLITGVKRITENSVYDYAQDISLIDGTPYVYWVTCNDNNLESGSDNTLKKASFSGTVSVIQTNLNYILDLDAAYINDKENVSYSMDADGNTITANDVNVFTLVDGVSTAYSKQNSTAYTTLFYEDFNDKTVLFVSDMSNIYYVDDGNVNSVFENERDILTDINYENNNGKGMFVWTENNGADNAVYSSTFENGRWTTPIKVSNENSRLITSVDTTMYNSQLRGVCMSSAVVFNEENQHYEVANSNLCEFTITEVQDIAVDSIIIDERDIKIGKETLFDVYVTNNGSEMIKNVLFKITDGLGFSKMFTKEINLASGDSKAVTLTHTAPENYSKTELTVTVSATEITDENSANDSTSVEIGTPEIIVSESSVYQLGSDFVITALITNESDLTAQDINILTSFDHDFSNVIKEFKIDDLGARETFLFEQIVHKSDISFDENGVAKVYIMAEFGNGKQSEICVLLRSVETDCGHPVTEKVVVESTCNEKGYNAVVCCGCGDTLRKTEKPKSVHNRKNGICTVCGDEAVIYTYSNSNSIVVIDYDKKVIYGITPNDSIYTVFLEYIGFADTVYYEYEGSKISTGKTISLYDKSTGSFIDKYTFVVLGDVTGDGWTDGQDAVLVLAIASGLLTETKIDTAVYIAADCNVDGKVNEQDVSLLQSAGLILAEIDQSKPYDDSVSVTVTFNDVFNFDTFDFSEVSRGTVSVDSKNESFTVYSNGIDTHTLNYIDATKGYMMLIPGHTYKISYDWENLSDIDDVLRPHIFASEDLPTEELDFFKQYLFDAPAHTSGTQTYVETIPEGKPYVTIRFGVAGTEEGGTIVRFSNIHIQDITNIEGFADDVSVPMNSNGETIYSVSVRYGNKISTAEELNGSLPIVTRTGYIFEGWYDDYDENGNGTGNLYDETSIIGKTDLKLYAKWRLSYFKVTFDDVFDFETFDFSEVCNGSVTVDHEDKSLTIYSTGVDTHTLNYIDATKGHMMLIPGHTYRVSYDWANLSDVSDILRPHVFAYENWPAPELDFFEQWLLDAPAHTSGTQTFSVRIPEGKPYVTVRFGVWGTEQGGTVVKFSNIHIQDITNPDGVADDVSMPVNSDGETVYNISVRYGNKISSAEKLNGSLPTITRTGYTFAGWYDSYDEKGNGTGNLYDESAIIGATDLKLYAKWIKEE